MKKNIGVNALLNASKQLLSIIFPLITYPYALRTLGVINIGRINYASSIITYFALFASLGISTYAIREGAKFRNDRAQLTDFASQIFSINIISTIFSYILLLLFVTFSKSLSSYSILILIQSITIVLTTIGVDWINSIFEDYLYTTIRSFAIQIITLIFLFIFIHNSNDYLLYALLQVISSAIICISNWLYCRKYVRLRFTFKINYKKHLPPILILFANSLAISIYVNFDTTMLGLMKGDAAVGLYSAAVKIYMIIKNMLMAIYQVTIPRLSYLYEKKDYIEYKILFSDLWGKLSLVLFPCAVGLCMLAPEIMTLVGGETYLSSGPALRILSLALIFSIYAGFVSPVLNVTIGREKENLKATVLSAIVNFVLNIYFIQRYSFVGASFTTMISEAVAFLFPLVRIKGIDSFLEVKKISFSVVKVIFASSFISIIYFIIKKFIVNYLAVIFFTILISVPTYFLILFILKDTYFLNSINYLKKGFAIKYTKSLRKDKS